MIIINSLMQAVYTLLPHLVTPVRSSDVWALNSALQSKSFDLHQQGGVIYAFIITVFIL